MNLLKTRTKRRLFLTTGCILIATCVLLYLLGRIPICSCGYIKLWHTNPNSPENSQHIADFYTFSHIIHGFVFYGILTKFKKRFSLEKRFIAALLVEAGWEILENSPLIIDRYRTATISLDYYGDSIINSLSDIAAMILGFFMAYKMNVWHIVAITIMAELIVGYLIRDNLTLNVLMLIYPFEWVKNWQLGAVTG